MSRIIINRSENNKPITYRQFYDMVLEKTRKEPEWDESSLEYISYTYSGREKEPIDTHHFDVTAEVMYGGNEGIICRVGMIVHEDYGRIKRVPLAMLKTLDESRDAYMEMGRLGTLFSYCAMQVAEERIDEFEVEK